MKLKHYNNSYNFLFSEESQAFKSESSVQDEDVTDQSDDENNRDKKETFKVVQQKTTSKSSTAVDSPIKQQNSNR